jgi:diaminohydroxyphosphoribosylaminopyrimidine deaminase / 5-amino-6-(5-phosphoribosylamino)uracil reductase
MGGGADATVMRRALGLARAQLGRTGPNPAVGCVIVSEAGQVVGEAATADGGRPHAEEQALIAAGARARAATAYVPFDPSARPTSGARACADLLLAAQVTRVVIAAADPSPSAAGEGVARLRAAGVEVAEDVLTDEAEPLYAAYRAGLAAAKP